MKKYAVIFILATAMLLAFTTCGGSDGDVTIQNDLTIEELADIKEPTPQPLPGEISGTRHVFENLGFSIVFPAEWAGKYGLNESYVEFDDETRHFVEMYHIATREEIGAGWLWSFSRIHENNFIEYGQPTPHNHAVLYQGGGYAFIMLMPSGVEYNETPGSETAAEYLEIASQWELMVDSFRLIDSLQNNETNASELTN